jgi:hypothetical protein
VTAFLISVINREIALIKSIRFRIRPHLPSFAKEQKRVNPSADSLANGCTDRIKQNSTEVKIFESSGTQAEDACVMRDMVVGARDSE